MIAANADGSAVRKWLKRWLGEALSARWLLQPREVWWAECGSVKWIWTDDYFVRVKQYVARQRTKK
jgi:hypothetical protein